MLGKSLWDLWLQKNPQKVPWDYSRHTRAHGFTKGNVRPQRTTWGSQGKTKHATKLNWSRFWWHFWVILVQFLSWQFFFLLKTFGLEQSFIYFIHLRITKSAKADKNKNKSNKHKNKNENNNNNNKNYNRDSIRIFKRI